MSITCHVTPLLCVLLLAIDTTCRAYVTCSWAKSPYKQGYVSGLIHHILLTGQAI